MGESKHTGSLSARLLPEVGGACSLYGVRVGVCPGVNPEGCLKWFAHPLGDVVYRGVCAVPCFFSGLFKSGSWAFWSLCIICSAFASVARAHSYFLTRTVSSYFVTQGEIQVQASQHFSKRSQVPACLTYTPLRA